MTTFTYKAFDGSGQVTEGTLVGRSEADVIAKLRAQELSPLQISESISESASTRSRRSRRVGRRDIGHLTTQLASLLEANMPLARALAAVADQAAHPKLGELARALEDGVREGRTLSEVMGDFPEHFPGFYRSMVRAGEVGGQLDEAFARIAEMMERNQEMRSRLTGALTYPAIMLAVMIGSITVLITYVVPRFTDMFDSLGGTLPLPTRILIALSSVLSSWWWLGLLLIGGAVMGFRSWYRTEAGRMTFDRLALRVPVAGDLIGQITLATYAGTLGSLLESGVPILQASEATNGVVSNVFIRAKLEAARRAVQEGSTLADALRDDSYFPKLISGMVGTGEESGTLPQMLQHVGQYYRREADARIDTLTTLMEPAVIIGMGLAVGFVVVSILLPIFDMTQMVE